MHAYATNTLAGGCANVVQRKISVITSSSVFSSLKCLFIFHSQSVLLRPTPKNNEQECAFSRIHRRGVCKWVSVSRDTSSLKIDPVKVYITRTHTQAHIYKYTHIYIFKNKHKHTRMHTCTQLNKTKRSRTKSLFKKQVTGIGCWLTSVLEWTWLACFDMACWHWHGLVLFAWLWWHWWSLRWKRWCQRSGWKWWPGRLRFLLLLAWNRGSPVKFQWRTQPLLLMSVVCDTAHSGIRCLLCYFSRIERILSLWASLLLC